MFLKFHKISKIFLQIVCKFSAASQMNSDDLKGKMYTILV